MPDTFRHRRPVTWSRTYLNTDGDLITVSSLSCSVNTTRVPSKANGRRGTRRAYKRAHPPGWQFRWFGAFYDA